ncbi:hypothetical protein D3C86_1802910 [compost metagenome]
MKIFEPSISTAVICSSLDMAGAAAGAVVPEDGAEATSVDWGAAGAAETSTPAAGCVAAGAAAALPASSGTAIRRLALPGFVTMARSLPFLSAGTETVATSSDVKTLPSLPVALSTI